MAAARGSSAPGRWWSVISTSIPAARAASTPSTLAMPLSYRDEQLRACLFGERHDLGVSRSRA